MDHCWQSRDPARQAGGYPTARSIDRHVRTGGVDQPETKPAPPRQATHTVCMPKAPCGRASISGMWDMSTICATCA